MLMNIDVKIWIRNRKKVLFLKDSKRRSLFGQGLNAPKGPAYRLKARRLTDLQYEILAGKIFFRKDKTHMPSNEATTLVPTSPKQQRSL